MTRDLRLLVAAILAALTASIAIVPAASAEEFVLMSPAGAETVTLSGTQYSETDVMTTTAGSITCKNATYSGTMKWQTSALEVAPSYSECVAFGFAASVETNGCSYRFTAGSVEGEAYEGTADIVCPAGKEITVKASVAGITKCTIHVPAQSGLGTVTFVNVDEGNESKVVVALNLSGIQYTHTAGTGVGSCSGGSGSAGTYVGSGLISGKVEGSTVAVLAQRPPPHGSVYRDPMEIYGANGGPTGFRSGWLHFSKVGEYVIDSQSLPGGATFAIKTKSKDDKGCGGTIKIVNGKEGTPIPKGCLVQVEGKGAAIGTKNDTDLTSEWHDVTTPSKIEVRTTTVVRTK